MDNAFPPLLSFFFASLPSFSVYHFLPVLALVLSCLVLSCLVLSCLVLSCRVFCYFLILNSLKLWTHKKRLVIESTTLIPASSCASTISKSENLVVTDVLSCLVLSCLVLSCLVCLVLCSTAKAQELCPCFQQLCIFARSSCEEI